jgi:hypothetical protein
MKNIIIIFGGARGIPLFGGPFRVRTTHLTAGQLRFRGRLP